jgi:hypothetical protein
MAVTYDALSIPPTAADKGGIEVLRAGVVDGTLNVMLRRAFNDPRAWGILLADVARQVSRIYADENNEDQAQVLASIREALIAEINAPANSGVIGPAG